MYPDDLLKTFQDGMQHNFADPEKNVIVHSHHLGEVVITSGHIVVTNPLAQPDWPAFTTVVPTGRFPVRYSDAYLVAYPDFAHHSISAMVRFQDSAPIVWQIARHVGWENSAVEKINPAQDVWGGYLNEWGFLSFMDAAAGALLTDLLDQDHDLANTIIEAAEDHEPESCQKVVDEQSGLNLITFTCDGPGVSPAFFGIAADGSVVCLVVDCRYNARTLLLESL